MTETPQYPGPPKPEPMFNAPFMAVLFPALMVAGYCLQSLIGPVAEMNLLNGYALSALLLRQGQWELLVTYQFLHGSWTHVFFNAAFCLAFATPIVRAFGRAGWPSYVLFYLICGALAGLGHCLVNWRDPVGIIGASGAVSGLIGAAMRLRGDGQLNGFTSPRVATMTVLFVGMNLATSLISVMPGAVGVQIAWQAHIAGYAAGLLLIGPWLRLFHRPYFTRS